MQATYEMLDKITITNISIKFQNFITFAKVQIPVYR
jgi:hypothetical protein